MLLQRFSSDEPVHMKTTTAARIRATANRGGFPGSASTGRGRTATRSATRTSQFPSAPPMSTTPITSPLLRPAEPDRGNGMALSPKVRFADVGCVCVCDGNRGVIYTITDVEELGDWMRSCLEEHPLFEAVSEEELETDPVVKLLSSATEEGQKVARNGGQTFKAVYRRVALHEE
uniref:tRNA (guanine(46)-N(7))-methyltransferase n=1 Tax=Ananas comosus var. bracteatus TaxID=296719 RepID=A0A6V7P7J9_ANACO|nr:unnamed protein product [Ananas comosus var. bracteatus]